MCPRRELRSSVLYVLLLTPLCSSTPANTLPTTASHRSLSSTTLISVPSMFSSSASKPIPACIFCSYFCRIFFGGIFLVFRSSPPASEKRLGLGTQDRNSTVLHIGHEGGSHHTQGGRKACFCTAVVLHWRAVSGFEHPALCVCIFWKPLCMQLSIQSSLFLLPTAQSLSPLSLCPSHSCL